jgi:tetratricopeptide (TPR) repeat protein
LGSLLEILGKGLSSTVAELLEKRLQVGATESPALLQSQVQQHPDRADARWQLGLSLLTSTQYEQAREQLQQACRLRPDHIQSRLALAAVCDEVGQTEQAYEHLRHAIRMQPDSANWLFAAGLCLEKLQRSDEAAELYRDAVKIAPELTAARQRLAAIALLTDDLPTAVEQYEDLRRANPGDTDVTGCLAHLYHRAGRYREAIAAFENVIAMDPQNWALADDEVESLVEAGELREACERLYQLLEVQGSFADIHLRLGEVLTKMGQDEQALRHYQSALMVDPNYLEGYVSLGTHHLSHGRWAEAAEAFCQASDINDSLLLAYVGLGVAQEAAGKKNQALEAFTLAGSVEPNSNLLLKEMARLQLKAAMVQECEAALARNEQPPVAEADIDSDDLLHVQLARHERQVKEHPGYADLHYRYGVLLRAEGRLGEAAEHFEAASKINPTYISAMIRLGITQQELGRTDDAIETFKRALQLKPQYADLHYRLAVLYTDRKALEEAVGHMEKAAGLSAGNDEIRASLALSLQNMGLMDRVAATWRSLAKVHKASKGQSS